MQIITHYSSGDSFGELALQYDRNLPDKVIKRAATITCTTDCIFAIMNKGDYRVVLDKINAQKNEILIAFFR